MCVRAYVRAYVRVHALLKHYRLWRDVVWLDMRKSMIEINPHINCSHCETMQKTIELVKKNAWLMRLYLS